MYLICSRMRKKIKELNIRNMWWFLENRRLVREVKMLEEKYERFARSIIRLANVREKSLRYAHNRDIMRGDPRKQEEVEGPVNVVQEKLADLSIRA